jgi:hypothetical protein
MDGGNEQRVATKFCSKAGLSATETLVLVQKAYGNEDVNQSNVLRWYEAHYANCYEMSACGLSANMNRVVSNNQ